MKRSAPVDSRSASQQGGALFNMHFTPTALPQRWRDVLERNRYRATLQQTRDPRADDNVGEELVSAMRRAIDGRMGDTPNLQPHHTWHFTMQSDRFAHAFQSTTFTVREFQQGSDRLATYLQSLADKLNSNEDFEPNDTFTVEMTMIRTPGRGAGRNKRHAKLGRLAIDKVLNAKRSIVKIDNDDQLCCARAIVTMQAWADGGPDDPNYQNLRRGRPVQTIKAKELHRLAGVSEGPCGLVELRKFQEVLPDYQIKVMSVDKPHMITFKGPENHKKIMLVHVDDHYHGCNSFSGFLERTYFCHDCDKGFKTDDYIHHPCKKIWCRGCKRNTCTDWQTLKAVTPFGEIPKPRGSCPNCNRHFYGEECYLGHFQPIQTGHRPICEYLKKCLACHSEYEAAPKLSKNPVKPHHRHRCGWAVCRFCDMEVDQSTHQCFIQPIRPEQDQRKLLKVMTSEVGIRAVVRADEDGKCWVEETPPLFVYADYESMTDASGLQTPIMVCCESEEEEDTTVCYGLDCTEQFFDYLDERCVDDYGNDREVIVLFHNFKGYDGMFVLKYLYENHRLVERQITVGTKVLSLQNDLITFKDSLCFLPFPLSSFPATFGLTELKKGFFPHLFNTEANQTFVGVIPDTEYYDPEGMSHKKKAEFLQWHAEQVREGYRFAMRKEMEEYCISDVKLLKAGCQKFQEQFHQHADFLPMEKCITIASACNRYWRKMLLPLNTIAIEPPRGWFGATSNTSKVAREWLAYRNRQLRLQTVQGADPIRTATNGGEVRVYTPAQSFLVDGYDENTHTVYEFNGCLWHGCPKCYPKRNLFSKLHDDRTFEELWQATIAKAQILRTEGYTVETMWECQWRKLKKQDDDIISFMANYQQVPPLNPRDAFFGGRTNAVCLYHIVDPTTGEKVFYIDVTSLYPWVNATAEYPVGHPQVITDPPDQDIHNYFGVALVDIIPPYELYHPVLPHRQGGKLTFPLCATCVQEEMSKPMLERSCICLHTPTERMLRGTWCTPELQTAASKGYQLVKIHEVWHFPKRVKGLFKDYVNQWLKIKQESAGYPSWADTEEKKAEYRSNYLEHQGIDLDADKIVKNPGRKATAKLMLNSFWGKFGENLNKPQVHTVSNPVDLFTLLYSSVENVERIRLCTKDLLEVVTREPEENQPDNGKRNIFIAAFTTCYARLKLYEYLDRLKKQVLYFDTDSVVYSWKPGDPQIPLGDYLGEMTDELEGDTITEFVSGGPKNYAYKTESGKVCCKVRGFTLNVRGDRQLNFDVIKQNVLDELQRPLPAKRLTDVDNPHFFVRDPTTKRIRVIPRKKQYGLVFDKRVVDTVTYKSFPYGYSPLRDEDLDLAQILSNL